MMHVCMERDRTGWPGVYNTGERERGPLLSSSLHGSVEGESVLEWGPCQQAQSQCLGVHAQSHQLRPPAQQLDSCLASRLVAPQSLAYGPSPLPAGRPRSAARRARV